MTPLTPQSNDIDELIDDLIGDLWMAGFNYGKPENQGLEALRKANESDHIEVSKAKAKFRTLLLKARKEELENSQLICHHDSMGEAGGWCYPEAYIKDRLAELNKLLEDK